MKILTSLEAVSSASISKPVVLTIGFFDGVHRGHEVVFSRVRKLSKSLGQQSAAITFSNHPATVLRPDQLTCVLCTLPHKIALLERAGIDLLTVLQFTKSFSQQSAEGFLFELRAVIPFSHLILGHDATLGKDRQGSRALVPLIAKELGCEVEYLDPLTVGGEVVSSSRIRAAVQKGDFQHAELLLGRKYSIYAQVITGRTHGKSIGFPTANIDVAGLCLPPSGVYVVKVLYGDKQITGVANLGVAPTVRKDHHLLLEVHLLDWDQDLYGQMIEVLFQSFIRPEKKFPSVDALKEQIAKDIQFARKL